MKSSKNETETKRSSKNTKVVEKDESPPKLKGRASPSRSPARGRKLSPGPKSGRKSPSRKSPSRKSPSRKSPSRKSPSRKSPSRNVKEEAPKSPSRRPALKSESKAEIITKVEIKSSQNKVTDLNGREPVSRDGVRERKPKSDEPSTESSKIVSRRSIRIKSASENYEKLLSLAQSTKLPKSDQSFETFSDDDDDEKSPQKKNKSATRTLLTPTDELSKVPDEFGGRIGVVAQFIFAMLLLVGCNLICSKSQCNFSSLPNLEPFKSWNVWFSWKATLIYSSYFLLQTIISLVPCCGKKVILPDKGTVFTANGLFALTIILFDMLLLEYFDIPIFQMIYQEYYALLAAAIAVGSLLGAGVYIKSRKVLDNERNQYGNTGYFLYDFYAGREVNPVLFGKINVKLLVFRTSVVAFIIINLVYLYSGISVKNFPILSLETVRELQTYKQIIESISVNPTLLTFAALQVFYATYVLAWESSLITTFEYHSEGTGLLLTVGYGLYPFMTPLINKCILEHDIVLSKYVLALAVIIHFIGFYIYHASNNQKNSFRLNPNDPKLAHLDSIPTFHGKRLLISGWWGFVRHPNYLGDIIFHLTWATAVVTEPPVLLIIATVLFLAVRAKRDGERCRRRYGAAWERYCRRVPYNLVPKIF